MHAVHDMKHNSVLLTRRCFLTTILRVTGGVTLPAWLPGDRDSATFRSGFLSACDDADGRHFIAGYNRSGQARFRTEVPQRMHGMTLNPVRPQQAVFFARRPGTDIYSIDLYSGSVIRRLASPPGRHFCGHGCFSADGQYLFTSENNYAKNQGLVSVRDASTLAVLEEWPTGGRDPHEIRLLDGGTTMVVANGGILTSPDRPGVNLDPGAMQPSLVYLDTADGKMRGEFRLYDRQLSIRHIDVSDEGLVAIALQYEGRDKSRMPLLASHAGENNLQLFAVEACDWKRMNDYTGSVKFTAAGNIAAVSSPRGNCLGFWNIAEREILAQHYIHDVCGIGYDIQDRTFVVTTGAGAIYNFDSAGRSTGYVAALPEIRWDNHLLALT
jgi:hypothetical protein